MSPPNYRVGGCHRGSLPNFAWTACSDGVATVAAFFGAGFQVGSSYNSGPGPWNPAGGPTASNTNNGSRGLYTSTANSNTTTANAMWVPVISGGGATNAVTDGGANNTT